MAQEATLDDDTPIAWTAIRRNVGVYTSDGEPVGSVDEVLGDEGADIFHGIVVDPSGPEGPVCVLAQDVEAISVGRITLSISSEAFSGLPTYVEEPSFKLGIRGIFRHRPGWVKDERN